LFSGHDNFVINNGIEMLIGCARVSTTDQIAGMGAQRMEVRAASRAGSEEPSRHSGKQTFFKRSLRYQAI
jgi:hypothetical protein